jgi:hypothetical protein
MDGLDQLDQFDLGEHGDRHERNVWPLLSNRFPSYEILWRRLIVPLTCRIDPKMAASPEQWIRLRPGVPPKYEQASMAHYSVFYFLGRAVKRRAEEKTALEYPEDVLFLLDSVGDNFKTFRRAMNELAADCGHTVFKSSGDEVSPFREISAYRDIFLHNTVMGRGVGVEKTYIPKWSADKTASPLERAKRFVARGGATAVRRYDRHGRTARPVDRGCLLYSGKFLAEGSGSGHEPTLRAKNGEGHRT